MSITLSNIFDFFRKKNNYYFKAKEKDVSNQEISRPVLPSIAVKQ
jgi:hypothetical protein